MFTLVGTTCITVIREPRHGMTGFRHTFYITSKRRGLEMLTEQQIAPRFDFTEGQLYNAIEKWWSARGAGVWECNVTDFMKRHAAAARASSWNKPKRPKRPNRTPAERRADTMAKNKRYGRRYVVKLRAAGIAPDPFARETES